MALRRRRGESDDTFEDHHPHLDWNAIVQVEPDVGVTPGEQWPTEPPGRSRPDPYAPPSEGIYDVEKEVELADPAAVDAWFNGEIDKVVPSTRQRPDPVPVPRPVAPGGLVPGAGPSRPTVPGSAPVSAPAAFGRPVAPTVFDPTVYPGSGPAAPVSPMPAPPARPTPSPAPPARPTPPPMSPARPMPARVEMPPMPAPLLPPARFDPNAAPFDPALARPGARTVSSRTRPKPPGLPANIVAEPPFAAPMAPPPSGPPVSPASAPRPRPATSRSTPPTSRPSSQPGRGASESRTFVAQIDAPAPTETSRVDRRASNPTPPRRSSYLQGPHEVRWAGQPETAANTAKRSPEEPAVYTKGVSSPRQRDNISRSATTGASRGHDDDAALDTSVAGAFTRRSGAVPVVRNGDSQRASSGDDRSRDSRRRRTNEENSEGVFVIELSDEPLRFAQPFRVEPPSPDYDDDLDLINGLIFIDKPEPLHDVIVRRARPVRRASVAAAAKAEGSNAFRASVSSGAATSPVSSRAATSPVSTRAAISPRATEAANRQKPFSFVSLVGDGTSRITNKPSGRKRSRSLEVERATDTNRARQDRATDSQKSQAKAVASQSRDNDAERVTSGRRPRPADSVVYRRDDDPRGTKRIPATRKKKPALSIRTVEDPVERLLIDHQDLQLAHYGPIAVESSLWPPDMRIDSVNKHIQAVRWPRDEGIEVWIRLPQICDALWGELARIDIVSGSTVETWITNSDLDDRILHQMRLSIRVDDAENPRELLRVYRAQAEEFVGYGLDGIISRPTERS